MQSKVTLTFRKIELKPKNDFQSKIVVSVVEKGGGGGARGPHGPFPKSAIVAMLGISETTWIQSGGKGLISGEMIQCSLGIKKMYLILKA